jgi:pterin-4a-carbinolamine dehydratase
MPVEPSVLGVRSRRAPQDAAHGSGGEAVIRYQEFLEAVAKRAGLARSDDTKAAIKAVLAGVAHWVDEAQRQAIAEVVPNEFRHVLDAPRPVVGGDLARFLQFVSFVTEITPERARYETQAVLSYLGDTEPAVAEALRERMPAEFADLFTAPGDGPPPERAASAAEPVPTELTADELAAVLRRLPGWRGNTRRLSRTAQLPRGWDRALLDRIHLAEQELNHHAKLDESPDGLTFTLWTHSRDVVTELDVRLAERISTILERG